MGGHTKSRVEGQNRGRLEKIKDVGKNKDRGRTQGVNKEDTAENSQLQKWKEKLKTWKDMGLVCVNGGRKIMDGDEGWKWYL